MIDRIELGFVHQAEQMREFQRNYTIRFKDGLQARSEIVQVRDMGKNIVADDDIGRTAGGSQILRSVDPEKFSKGWNPFSFGFSCNVLCWIDPQDRNTRIFKVFEQVTVIAGDLYHQAFRTG